MPRPPRESPRLVVADPDGQLLDHPRLLAAGLAGPDAVPLPRCELVEVPRGSDFYTLPERDPVGIDPDSGEVVVLREPGLVAASVFLAPAWTRSHRPAYASRPGAPTLPLYAYAALGYAAGRFWTTAVRVDESRRQDPWRFQPAAIQKATFKRLERLAGNRIVEQLARCSLEYGCRAAQNYALGREEAPLPTSVACNAQCVGCLSMQPDGAFRASHERLTRRVTPEEIVTVARDHWRRVPDGVVSFGQGCEGEPLLEADVLVPAVRELTASSPRGTVNMNSNASRPEAVAALAEAGLDSMRVSLNSARPDVYAAYYAPRGYDFGDVERSVVEMKRRGRFVSTNLLYFPGVTDTPAEIEAFADFAARTGIDLVQVRNLNVDPELYLAALPDGTVGPGLGVSGFLAELRAKVPGIAFGYFNPTRERYAELAAERAGRAEQA